MASSRKSILIVVAIAVVTAAGGFAAATLIVSPEDAAARTAPPAAGPITVPIERKVLNADIVTRGDIAFTGSVEVVLSTGTNATAVVTGRIPEVGSVINNGSILLEVTGRPVLALSGELPTYRSLGPGNTGPDVEQLEIALVALGFSPGTQDQLYDADTAAAVAELYKSLGYEAPQPPQEVTAAAIGAQDSFDMATQAVTDAQKALSEAAKGKTESERLQMQANVDQMQDAYNKALSEPSPPDQAKVAKAQKAVDEANAYQAYADAGLAQAQASNAENIADWETAVGQGRQGVESAQAALDSASAGGPPDQATIKQALSALKVAKAEQSEGLQAPDTSVAQQAVTNAAAALTAAQTDLDQAKAAAGTPLPATEIVWLADLPRRVDDVLVRRGSVIDGAVMNVSGADLSVQARVSAQEAGLLKNGLEADLTVPGTGTIKAIVAQIGGDAPGSSTADPPTDGSGSGTLVILQPQDVTNEQAQALRGTNVKITIPVASTAGEVLTSPVAALFSDEDGTPRVEVLAADGSRRFQKVEVGLSTGGDVEVRPISDQGADVLEGDSTLTEGSLVIVGQ